MSLTKRNIEDFRHTEEGIDDDYYYEQHRLQLLEEYRDKQRFIRESNNRKDERFPSGSRKTPQYSIH